MSVCIHRKPGVINKERMMCGLRIGPCPWWRALFCIPMDLAKAIGRSGRSKNSRPSTGTREVR